MCVCVCLPFQFHETIDRAAAAEIFSFAYRFSNKRSTKKKLMPFQSLNISFPMVCKFTTPKKIAFFYVLDFKENRIFALKHRVFFSHIEQKRGETFIKLFLFSYGNPVDRKRKCDDKWKSFCRECTR